MSCHYHQALFLVHRVDDGLHSERFEKKTQERIKSCFYIENGKRCKHYQQIGAEQSRADIALEIFAYDKRHDISAAGASSLFKNYRRSRRAEEKAEEKLEHPVIGKRHVHRRDNAEQLHDPRINERAVYCFYSERLAEE